MELTKSRVESSICEPLEKLTVSALDRSARRLLVLDGTGRTYHDEAVKPGSSSAVRVRGDIGVHRVLALDAGGAVVDEAQFRVAASTSLSCDNGPYAKLFDRLQQLISRNAESEPWVINGRRYQIIICWSRDHVYTLKAAKYFMNDVTSGLDYYLESQTPNGMFWDCIYHNSDAPAPTWLGEALGKGWYRYDDNMRYIVRRVPVLADTEYVFTEGVWYAWKATGDDAWMERQLPRLEKALTYMTTDPLRWSKKHGLVRRSFTADEWDFANPHYCAGDHRCIHPEDPTFFFHGNNSGVYSMYWRMAQMYEHLGNATRARELREAGEALRARANKALWFKTHYGHMIPESVSPEKVYALVGDERERMSLSTGYTLNRGLPTHAMAVKTIKEYQRRYRANKKQSFAEWWTMDPPYAPSQWPSQDSNTAGCPVGEYMNGGICSIIAGEISKAAFDHGCENYAVDILERTWQLMERDNLGLHQVYRRQSDKPQLPRTAFTPIDISTFANRGLKHKAFAGVEAWTGENTNDMRNLPVGRTKFGAIEFAVVDPARNEGRSVIRLHPAGENAPQSLTIPVDNLSCRSVYFLHSTASSAGNGAVVGTYDLHYTDGTVARAWIKGGSEIGHWWGSSDGAVRGSARRAWWGPTRPGRMSAYTCSDSTTRTPKSRCARYGSKPCRVEGVGVSCSRVSAPATSLSHSSRSFARTACRTAGHRRPCTTRSPRGLRVSKTPAQRSRR